MPDEDFPVFPQGSRPKKTVISPAPDLPSFLVPNHRYLFKFSVERHPVQFWSEIIAYELGRLVNADIPPALVAIDSETGKPGALIEFFYGHPGELPPIRFYHGGEYLKRVIPNFDDKKGRQHSVKGNLRLCRRMEKMGLLSDSIRFWATTFVFDALIGNTDRHQENWGFLWTLPKEPAEARARFSPAFDNGTSLGYEQLDDRLSKFDDAVRLRAYIERGRHHVRWTDRDEKQQGHIELCRQLAETEPRAVPYMAQVLRLDFDKVADMLEWCTLFDTPVPFSAERAAFVLRLIKARHKALVETLRLEDE